MNANLSIKHNIRHRKGLRHLAFIPKLFFAGLFLIFFAVLGWRFLGFPDDIGVDAATITSRPSFVEAKIAEVSPAGASGGKIIPASCDIGYWDGEPAYLFGCPDPIVTVTPSSDVIVSPGNSAFSYSSQYAYTCNMSTSGSGAGIGDFTDGPRSKSFTIGPFVGTGSKTFTVTCYDFFKTKSASGSFTVTWAPPPPPPDVRVQFSPVNPWGGVSVFTPSSFGPIPQYTPVTLSWSGNGNCTATNNAGIASWNGTKPSSGSQNITYTPYSSSVMSVNVTFTLSCTLGGITEARSTIVSFRTEYDPYGGSSGCFTGETLITMADGTYKPIQSIRDGDVVQTSQGPRKAFGLKAYNIDGPLYAFNGSGDYFVTANHAFKTTDGWKALDPVKARKENPDLEIGLLVVGDTLVLENGDTTLLHRIDSQHTKVTVYNFEVEDMHEYYANGYLVHNIPANQKQ